MDTKRAKELTSQLSNLIDQIDKDKISEINKMSEDLKNEIRVKVMAILNELDIRSGEVISFD
jgi:BMFP domain-containing protein YqiC